MSRILLVVRRAANIAGYGASTFAPLLARLTAPLTAHAIGPPRDLRAANAGKNDQPIEPDLVKRFRDSGAAIGLFSAVEFFTTQEKLSFAISLTDSDFLQFQSMYFQLISAGYYFSWLAEALLS